MRLFKGTGLGPLQRGYGTAVDMTFSDSAGVHGTLVRITRDVAAGKLLIVSGIHLGMRVSAAGSGTVFMQSRIQINQQSVGNVIIAQLVFDDNTLGNYRTIHIPCNYTLRGGDNIAALTNDSRTTGNMEWDINISAIEFDI